MSVANFANQPSVGQQTVESLFGDPSENGETVLFGDERESRLMAFDDRFERFVFIRRDIGRIRRDQREPQILRQRPEEVAFQQRDVVRLEPLAVLFRP